MTPVPVYAGGTEVPAGQAEIVLSPAAMKLAEIQTSPVVRKAVDAELRLVGTVALDEKSVRQIAARYGGRIDKLHVNYSGAVVKQGEKLAEVYSPDLLAAQEELLQAAKAAGRRGSDSGDYLQGLNAKTLEAARQKLLLLGLSEEQVKDVEKAGQATDHVAIVAPMAGTVVKKMVNEGDYVTTGAPLFTVADLSKVWLMLEAYESDLPLVEVGQDAEVIADAFPGRTFKGRVAFVDPTLNPETRTARLRVEVDNPDGQLKPETFGYGVLKRRIGGDGNLPLVIPASAPLITGTRTVVYVQVPNRERPTYDGKEVKLGPRAHSSDGDWYVVLSGLEEGQQVVTRGNFKIDSALQIQARPSLMSAGGEAPPVHQHGGIVPPQPAGGHEGHAVPAKLKPQATCPVMGGKIDRKMFADYQGKRVYFCCAGCPETFLKEPEKYLAKLRELGEEPEATPAPAPAAVPAAAPSGGHHH
jgi:Cu(I)/Ag(I) efflux system membrane fusion protein